MACRTSRIGCAAAALAAAWVLAPLPTAARTWRVTADGTGDVPTIQAAIDTAVAGDVILVASGIYSWTSQGTGDHRGLFRFYDRNQRITLRSEEGAGSTVLDAEYRTRVIYCHGMCNITFEGFTIRRGEAPEFGDYVGGGLFTHIPSETVRHCIFEHNRGGFGGGVGICINDGYVRIENCTFTGNTASSYGGAIAYGNGTGTVTVSGCWIEQNRAPRGGGIFLFNTGGVIRGTVITNNRADLEGGAVCGMIDSSPRIENCTICRNTAPDAALTWLDHTSVTVSRSIFAFNWGAAFVADGTCGGGIGCCDMYGNSGGNGLPAAVSDTGHNITLDPLFCGDAGDGKYHLRADSPCLPTNNPDGLWCLLIGTFPEGCGSVSVRNASWGAIKSIHR